MRSLKIWPQGLIGRITLVLVLAVLAELVGSSILYERFGPHLSRTDRAEHLAEQLVAAKHVLAKTPADDRRDVAASLSTDKVLVSWQRLPATPDTPRRYGLGRIADDMRRWEPTLERANLRLGLGQSSAFGDQAMTAAVQLPDQSWASVSAPLEGSPWAMLLRGAGSAAVLALGVAVAAMLLLRGLGTPLRALTQAAESVGQGSAVYVREEGARDLRRVARAFNAMQRRIRELLSARTQALAAVSHDLRTPLTRLRLRAGLVRDKETRMALEADLEEMAAMLDSLLAYLAGRSDGEEPRKVDVAALAMTVSNAASDAGGQVSYRGPEHLMAELRPIAVKRALNNLVENAVAYGGDAEIEVEEAGDVLVIKVQDNGEGVPENELGRIIEAFRRLDGARRRNTAGLGLGLSIVQGIVQGEGGELLLRNRPEGGLSVEMRLPLWR